MSPYTFWGKIELWFKDFLKGNNAFNVICEMEISNACRIHNNMPVANNEIVFIAILKCIHRVPATENNMDVNDWDKSRSFYSLCHWHFSKFIEFNVLNLKCIYVMPNVNKLNLCHKIMFLRALNLLHAKNQSWHDIKLKSRSHSAYRTCFTYTQRTICIVYVLYILKRAVCWKLKFTESQSSTAS